MSDVQPNPQLPEPAREADPIQLLVREVDGKRRMTVRIRRGDNRRVTEERIAEARRRYAHLDQQIDAIEIEQTKAQAAELARAAMKRLRRGRR